MNDIVEQKLTCKQVYYIGNESKTDKARQLEIGSVQKYIYIGYCIVHLRIEYKDHCIDLLLMYTEADSEFIY